MSGQVHYFKWTPWYYWVGSTIGMTLMGVMVLNPGLIPYSSLGVVGTFLHYLAYQHTTLLSVGFAAAVMAHIGEGYYAYVLARRMNLTTRDTMLWTMQTLALGFTSLLPLKAKYKKTL